MSKFDDILRARGANGNLPFYEDTHDLAGNFTGGGQSQYGVPATASYNNQNIQPTGPQQSAAQMYAFVPYQQQSTPPPAVLPQPTYLQQSTASSLYTAPLESKVQESSGFQNQRSYNNMVVYEPRTPEDVQTLIDCLARREPAIINLDNVEADISQRVLDFASGATYALGGTVNRISGNIFLLSPQGVDVNTIE